MQSFSQPIRRVLPPGFTLVELIVVIVILGVLGAAAGRVFFSRSSYDVSAYTNQARALIRFGQKVAVAQGRPVYVVIKPNSVALCFAADCTGDRVAAPSGNNSGSKATVDYCEASATWACEGVPSSMTLTRTGGVAGATFTFWYDPLGKPFAATDLVTATTSSFASIELVVSGATATDVEKIQVEAETGYVY